MKFFRSEGINRFFWIQIMSLIAEIILILHFCIVIFVTFGFFIIPIGYKFDWGWTSNTQLRILHSGVMTFVTVETLLGITCPLTYIENSLHKIYQSESFINYWIKKIIYWDFPAQFFIILYCIFLGWTFLMWKLYPPINIKKTNTSLKDSL